MKNFVLLKLNHLEMIEIYDDASCDAKLFTVFCDLLSGIAQIQRCLQLLKLKIRHLQIDIFKN
jgi:hypothetical protein